jgi:hypothetical protein
VYIAWLEYSATCGLVIWGLFTLPRSLTCSTLPRDQAGQSSRFVLFSAREKGPMVEREVEITEAMLQRLLQAFRRGLKPLTLGEMIEILRNS